MDNQAVRAAAMAIVSRAVQAARAAPDGQVAQAVDDIIAAVALEMPVLVVDVRRLRTIACAAPGCHTVGCYAIDSGLSADEDRERALRALEAQGWVTRGPDALCPPHTDRW